ncbi:MAG: hypothetical protein Q9187_002575 [Circinaria calcarea]
MALAMWRKFLIGLRIVERVHEEYGDDVEAHMKEEMNPFTNKNRRTKSSKTEIAAHPSDANGHPAPDHYDEETAGGFLPDEDEDAVDGSGFFQPGHLQEAANHAGGSGFIIEESTPQRNVPSEAIDINRVPSSSVSLLDDSEVSDQADFSEGKLPTPRSISSNSHGKKISTKTKASKPRKAGRPRKVSSIGKTNGRKDLLLQSDGQSEFKARIAEASESDLSPPESLNRLPVPSKNTLRAPPKRNAARKSEAAVKSHYFEHESDDGDIAGLNAAKAERASHEAVAQKVESDHAAGGKPQKSTRGRGRPRKTM